MRGFYSYHEIFWVSFKYLNSIGNSAPLISNFN